MTDEGSDETTSNTRRMLAELAHVEQALSSNRGALRALAQDFQRRRTAVRTTLSSLQQEQARLAVRRGSASRGVAEDPGLARLEDAVRTSESEHAQRLAEFERGLRTADEQRSRIEQEAALLEGKRTALAARLPVRLQEDYLEARASGLREGVVQASRGVCACGAPLADPEQPCSSCRSCGRLVIVAEPTLTQ